MAGVFGLGRGGQVTGVFGLGLQMKPAWWTGVFGLGLSHASIFVPLMRWNSNRVRVDHVVCFSHCVFRIAHPIADLKPNQGN